MSWRDLTFVHWRVSVEAVAQMLPAGLVADEYDGSAWVSLTPLVMARMRRLAVPVPGLSRLPGGVEPSTTPETNLRTYVRGPDGRDGLWFLSIEVGSPEVATVLRTVIGAPYYPGRLRVDRRGDTVAYAAVRRTARRSAPVPSFSRPRSRPGWGAGGGRGRGTWGGWSPLPWRTSRGRCSGTPA